MIVDLEAIRDRWLDVCPSCDAGIGNCNHPEEDYRPTMLSLVREVERLRGLLPGAPAEVVDQSTWPAHLRDDALHQKCSYCDRKTWSTEAFGRPCGMTLPHRGTCPGTFEAVPA
jgi:hypothetical protein